VALGFFPVGVACPLTGPVELELCFGDGGHASQPEFLPGEERRVPARELQVTRLEHHVGQPLARWAPLVGPHCCGPPSVAVDRGHGVGVLLRERGQDVPGPT